MTFQEAKLIAAKGDTSTKEKKEEFERALKLLSSYAFCPSTIPTKDEK